jgi:RND family efflux transporter MFP subunit
MTPIRRLSLPLTAALVAAALAACGQKGGSGTAAAASGASAPQASLLLSPEDLMSVGLSAHATGPVITGSLQPQRNADLRAEVSAVVMQVLRENGEAVHKGDLIVRLDDTAIRDAVSSAQEASRAAAQAYDQAQRTYDRQKTLQAQGMSSMQALDDAEVRRNGAQSDRVAADARTVAARQQLTRTEVRAPFDGIVSDRKVSAGDTAAVGKELVKVIDPTTMRFEGLVSADRVGEIKVGQQVIFHVNGYDQSDFTGIVRRIDASADAATRQLAVIVDFTSGNAPRVAGLYAEGHIASGGTQALMLPEQAVVKEGDKSFVWRIDGRKLTKTAIRLGERDPRTGQVAVVSGLAMGSQILRAPGSTLVDGQPVEMPHKAPAGALAAPARATVAAKE